MSSCRWTGPARASSACSRAARPGRSSSPSEEGPPVIARMWRGWVRTEDRAAYVEYIEGTGMAGYRATPGNEGAWMLARDLGEGRTEIVTFSLWASLDAIRAFAGDDIERAVFYPEDDRFLLDRETTVTHFEVVAG